MAPRGQMANSPPAGRSPLAITPAVSSSCSTWSELVSRSWRLVSSLRSGAAGASYAAAAASAAAPVRRIDMNLVEALAADGARLGAAGRSGRWRGDDDNEPVAGEMSRNLG